MLTVKIRMKDKETGIETHKTISALDYYTDFEQTSDGILYCVVTQNYKEMYETHWVEDGVSIYVENLAGKTIDKYYHSPKPTVQQRIKPL